MIKKVLYIAGEWMLPLILAIVLALLINTFLLFKVTIPSGSMIPTLNIDDQLFVTRILNYKNIGCGDILVFDSNELGKVLIKRVIGVPGDEIKISKGVVTVNGQVLHEPYVKNNDFTFEGNFKVPEDKYFFLGDNRSNSKDSREWSNPYIDKEDIMGEAFIKIYPFKDFGSLK